MKTGFKRRKVDEDERSDKEKPQSGETSRGLGWPDEGMMRA